MTTDREALEFWQSRQRAALKRFLEIPELPSGFYLPGEFATQPGRAPLSQTPEFHPTERSGERPEAVIGGQA